MAPNRDGHPRIRIFIAGVLGWLAFAIAAYDADRRGGIPARTPLSIGPATLVATYVIVVVWVRYNRRIYRERGTRRARHIDSTEWTHDRLGRHVFGNIDQGCAGREVVLMTVGRAKIYV